MNSRQRPDLSNRAILLLLASVFLLILLMILTFRLPTPGSVVGQTCAALGGLLLMAPLAFAAVKRSGRGKNPPLWFTIHLLSTLLGVLFILAHSFSGDWVSPPGFLLLLLLMLILQGGLLRTVISSKFSLLFAHSSSADGFRRNITPDQTELATLIQQKLALLQIIEAGADEGLFSLRLKHWCKHPQLSYHYHQRVNREAAIIGVREFAGVITGWSRRLHIFAGLIFYFGLLAHVIIVLFFAGYAADGDPIIWWHITAWGSSP
ncbi:MAG: drug/metabolite transporter superfamily protein YnfA [Planctomycetota bacterium]